MDEIAALAGVSKQTVYKHFADKERLFAEVILGTIDQVGEPFHAGTDTLGDTDDLATDLGELARRLITILLSPECWPFAGSSSGRPAGSPLQLAGHLDPAQPGHALRRRRVVDRGRPRGLRRHRGVGVPRRLWTASTRSRSVAMSFSSGGRRNV